MEHDYSSVNMPSIVKISIYGQKSTLYLYIDLTCTLENMVILLIFLITFEIFLFIYLTVYFYYLEQLPFSFRSEIIIIL